MFCRRWTAFSAPIILSSLALLASGCGEEQYPTYSGTYHLQSATFEPQSFAGELPPPQDLTITHRVDSSALGYQNYLRFEADIGEGHEKFTLDLWSLISVPQHTDPLAPTIYGFEIGQPVKSEFLEKNCGTLELGAYHHVLYGEARDGQPMQIQPSPQMLRAAYDRGDSLVSPKPGELRINHDAVAAWQKAVHENGGITITLQVRRNPFVFPSFCDKGDGTRVEGAFEEGFGPATAVLVYKMSEDDALAAMDAGSFPNGSPLLPPREPGNPALDMSVEKAKWMEDMSWATSFSYQFFQKFVDLTVSGGK